MMKCESERKRREKMGESEENESGRSKQRVRPIVRLGILLISHSNLFRYLTYLLSSSSSTLFYSF